LLNPDLEEPLTPDEIAHEDRVAAFMAQRQSEMPHYFTEVCEQFPALSDRQMSRRRRKEIPSGLMEDEIQSAL
jgi:hypothetical protein